MLNKTITLSLREIFVGLIVLVLGGLIYNWLTTSDNYLEENKAQIRTQLFIDSFTDDSLYFHIELENINQIAAKNIRYRLLFNGKGQMNNNDKYALLPKNEKLSIYLMDDILGLQSTEGNPFSVSLFLFYDSTWEGDTIIHREKVLFFIPRTNLQPGIISPASKQFDGVMDEQSIDSMIIVDKLKEKDGSLVFGFFERLIKDSVSHFIPPTDKALVYRTNQRDVVFQMRSSTNEVVSFQRNIKPNENKRHVILLNWFGENYTLYVDGDSADNIYRETLFE